MLGEARGRARPNRSYPRDHRCRYSRGRPHRRHTADGRARLLDDARSVEAGGAYAIVLEVVDYEISREITEMLSIPTIGIGAGPHCDAQVLVLHDILGMYPHSPSFAKRYAEMGSIATQALQSYAQEVRERTFP